MRRISFNSVSHLYDRTRGPPEHVMKQLLEILTSELSNYKTILDAGVGTGRFAKPLQSSGFEVVGVDIAKKMISKAVEKGVSRVLFGDVCFLPFRGNSFDATVCVHVLHLIGEWKMALREICRVTRSVMVSIFYVHKNPLREAYNRLLKGYGYESRRLGKGESELRNLVKPSRSVFVASYSTSADKRLAHLSQRVYSGQWAVPEDVNDKIVEELKSQFAGKMFHQELRLLMWEIKNLKAFCEKS